MHFDEFGRCIPGDIKSAHHKKTRRYFKLTDRKYDAGVVYDRSKAVWGSEITLSREEFISKVQSIVTKLQNDSSVSNVLKGNWVPFLIPKTGKIDSIGEIVQSRWVPAVIKSFESADPQHKVTNHNKDDLAPMLKIRPGTRHEKLLQKAESSDVVGIFFPAMTEYSFAATTERLDQLPSAFMLSGALDLSAAMIGAPDLLINRDAYAPLLWFSSYEIEPGHSIHYEPYGYNLTFNRRPHLNAVAEYWWHGLTVISE